MLAYLITLPAEVVASVVALSVALLGVLIRLLATRLPWLALLLERYREEWGTALGILLVNILQTYLPGGEWAGVSILLVELVVAVAVILLAKLGLRRAGFRLQ